MGYYNIFPILEIERDVTADEHRMVSKLCKQPVTG